MCKESMPLEDMDISQMSLFEKSKLGLLKAKPHCCEEQVSAPWGQGGVMPCNEKAVTYVGWLAEPGGGSVQDVLRPRPPYGQQPLCTRSRLLSRLER